ncbi:hypothetical protein [Streptomyces sp. NPDC001307]|uniref:hypothetical protein n=1 Tax=Streptomyces sp. NPDC001307 TaxID=3364560 RepID=UPI0036A5529B
MRSATASKPGMQRRVSAIARGVVRPDGILVPRDHRFRLQRGNAVEHIQPGPAALGGRLGEVEVHIS